MKHMSKEEREHGARFSPKWDAHGFVSAIVVDAGSKDILMLAFMDAEALESTLATGEAHFHSRSRGKLWKKGESSGHVLKVRDILVDCDQDALILICEPQGPTCHTGAASCFYRRMKNGSLVPVKT